MDTAAESTPDTTPAGRYSPRWGWVLVIAYLVDSLVTAVLPTPAYLSFEGGEGTEGTPDIAASLLGSVLGGVILGAVVGLVAALIVQDVLKGSSLVRGLAIVIHALLAVVSLVGLAGGGLGAVASLVTLAYAVLVIVVLSQKRSELVRRKSREIDSRIPLAVLGISVLGAALGSVISSVTGA